jgi:hypothetical protein
MHACIHTYMHAYIQTHACLHTYVHACMHAYICIYIYIHTYIHTHTHIYIYMAMGCYGMLWVYIGTCQILFHALHFWDDGPILGSPKYVEIPNGRTMVSGCFGGCFILWGRDL